MNVKIRSCTAQFKELELGDIFTAVDYNVYSNDFENGEFGVYMKIRPIESKDGVVYDYINLLSGKPCSICNDETIVFPARQAEMTII